MQPILPCCCACGMRLTWVGTSLHCDDHGEVDEHICDGLLEPGWRDTLICASDEPPYGWPDDGDAAGITPAPKPLRSPYWLRSGRHG